MAIVRRIAGIKFERTFAGVVTRAYEARGDFAVSLTYEIDLDRWTARVSSPHFYASISEVRLEQLDSWLRKQRDRHDELTEARRIREREARRIRKREARRRRADRSAAVTALCAVGAYFVGVVVGAASVAAKAAKAA